MSTRELGAALDVDQATVVRDRKAIATPDADASLKSTDADDFAALPDADASLDVGPDSQDEPEATTIADEQESDDEPAKTPAEKDAARKRRLPHGGWLPWLERHFDGSHDVASQYMKMAREISLGREISGAITNGRMAVHHSSQTDGCE